MSAKERSDNEPSDDYTYRDANGRFLPGNAFGMGYGRPLTYSTPEKLYLVIVEYFAWADATQKSKYAMADAALFLGFESRQSLWEYMQRDDGFPYVLNRMKTMFEGYHEKKLGWGGSFPGAAFWLKNFAGWKDEVTQNQNQTITKVEIVEKKRDE